MYRRTGMVAALLAASGGAAWMLRPHDTDALARIREQGVIRVGYAIEPPYAYVDEDGKPTGEGPELAIETARRMGVGRIEWRLTDFHLLLDGLESDQYDVIAAGMFVTPERERRIAFSRPTFRVREALLARRGHGLGGLVDIAALVGASGVRVVVLTGSVEERLLGERGLPRGRLIGVPDAHAGQALVAGGGAEVMMLSSPTLRRMAAMSQGQLEVLEGFDAQTPPGVGAFGFRKRDTALRAAWDDALGGVLGTPLHRAKVEPLGFSASELAP